MNPQTLFPFVAQLWVDAHSAQFYWTLFIFSVLTALSFSITHFLRAQNAAEKIPQRFAINVLRRIFTALLTLIFAEITRKFLAYLGWQHLSLLNLLEILLLAWILIRLFVYLLHAVFRQNTFLIRYERRISFVLWCFPLVEILDLSPVLIDSLQHIEFAIGKQKINLWMIVHSAFTVGATLLIAMWLASLVERRFMANETLDRSLREVFSRLIKAAIFTVALLFSLSLVGIDITTLSIFSGALAVGLGFGLQKIASNYVSGFIILLDRSIRIGNLITLDDKTTGTISRITTRYTVLKMLNGTEIIIPNEYLVSNIVRNLSYTSTRLALTISVQVSYATDLEKIMPLMVNVAKDHERVLADPEPSVLLITFADNGIHLDLNFWVADPELGTGKVRSDVSLALLKMFNENSVGIPYPQREVRLLS